MNVSPPIQRITQAELPEAIDRAVGIARARVLDIGGADLIVRGLVRV